MRGNRDDDTPFDDVFNQIENMLNDMMGPGGRVDIGMHQGGPAASPGNSVHADVHETDETIRVVADLPGVEKDDIDVKCDGETLLIRAASEGREYRDRLRLPAPVDEESARASYNNGVLEVTFDRRGGAGGTSINID